MFEGIDNMYHYIKGIVVSLERDHIVLDHHGMGYIIYVANPYDYKLNQEVTVFVYQQVREDAQLLFGFKTAEEKALFLKLILVKGIGPKTAVGILACGDYNKVVGAIEEGNINYLKKIPGIGPKAAGQIILDLQGKLVFDKKVEEIDESRIEAEEVLKALGYKAAEISAAMKKIDEKLDTNGYVKKALSLLVK